MATQAEQRRAIRDSVSRSRAATAADERRATGRRIEAERRGETVVQDLNRLITPQTQRRTLRSVPPVGALPASRGRGTYTPPPAAGGGIASPLIERLVIVDGQAVGDREYWPNGHTTSDGLFVLPAIKTWNFIDAAGAAVQLQLADPEGSPV